MRQNWTNCNGLILPSQNHYPGIEANAIDYSGFVLDSQTSMICDLMGLMLPAT